MKLQLSRIPSPIGAILLATDGERLCALEFEDHAERFDQALARQFRGAEVERLPDGAGDAIGAASRLAAYFAGDTSAIDQLPVATAGTPFQNLVWAALRRIPAGRTTTYHELAASIDRPTAIRAVGAANGANPISIVVPCHRVIGADGRLTGYGGGLPRKAWLLEHERKNYR